MSAENRRGSPPSRFAGSSSRCTICKSGYAHNKNSVFSRSTGLNFEYRCIDTTNLEFAPGHPLELATHPIRVPAEELYDLRVLHAVQQLGRLGVVHHPRHCAVQRLCTQQRPYSRTQRKLRRRALEPNTIKGQIIHCLPITALLVRSAKWVLAMELIRLLRKYLRVLDEIVSLDRVQLLQVLEQCHARMLILFPDDLSDNSIFYE